MKKHINITIFVLLLLNVLLIYFTFFGFTDKSKSVDFSSEDGLIQDISVDYSVIGNPVATIKITDISDTTENINQVSEDAALGTAFDISGNFSNFQLQNATITIKYDKEKLPENFSEDNLGILWYDEENDKMVEMDAKVNTEKGTVTFKTEHFSEYTLIDKSVWKEIWDKQVAQIRDNEAKFSVEFVIDDSGSMGENDPQSRRLTAAKSAINSLTKQDNYMIMKFESDSEVLQDFTSGGVSTDATIWDNFNHGGGTNIVDAVDKGIDLLKQEENGRIKIMILLTDGEDSNLSSNVEKLIQKAKENNVLIFGIGLQAGTSSLDFSVLSKLATDTNGKFYEIDETELSDIFTQITNYVVGVDGDLDTDGDGLPDWIELSGMRDQYGNFIVTNPYLADTDGDGISDGEEMGTIIYDVQNKISYFQIVSDPLSETIAYALGPSEDGEDVHDSGFRANVNAFNFRNFAIIGNDNQSNGICAGFAIFTEKVFNGMLPYKDGVYGIDMHGDFDTLIKSRRLYDYRLGVDTTGGVNMTQLCNTYTENPTDELYMDLNLIWELYLEWAYQDGNSYEYDGVGFLEFFKSTGILIKKVYNNLAVSKGLENSQIREIQEIFDSGKIICVDLGKWVRDDENKLSYYGHSINAYAIEKMSNNEYRLYVYDNNYPYNPSYIRDVQEGNNYITLTYGLGFYTNNDLGFEYNPNGNELVKSEKIYGWSSKIDSSIRCTLNYEEIK